MLAALAERTRQLSKLEKLVAEALHPELAPHCTVTGYQDGRLTLTVDTAGWATRLRYHTAEIRRKLEAAGTPVSECRVVLQHRPEVELPAAREPLTLSPAAARALESTAASVEHAPLAAALRRLAEHAKR